MRFVAGASGGGPPALRTLTGRRSWPHEQCGGRPRTQRRGMNPRCHGQQPDRRGAHRSRSHSRCCAPGRGVPTLRRELFRADSGDLARRHTDPDAGSAHSDAQIGLSRCDRPPNSCPIVRIIDTSLGISPISRTSIPRSRSWSPRHSSCESHGGRLPIAIFIVCSTPMPSSMLSVRGRHIHDRVNHPSWTAQDPSVRW